MGLTSAGRTVGFTVDGVASGGPSVVETVVATVVGLGIAALLVATTVRSVAPAVPLALGAFEAWNAASFFGFEAPATAATFHRELPVAAEAWAVPVCAVIAVVLLARGLDGLETDSESALPAN